MQNFGLVVIGAHSGIHLKSLISEYKDQKILFAEIGIELNASSKMWRDFFSNADLHLFEKDTKKIEQAKKDQLNDTYYYEIDVNIKENIRGAFQKTGKKH